MTKLSKTINHTHGCIYKISSPSGKVYIGSTINFRNRYSGYKRVACKTQTKLYSSFLSHGFDKHSFEVLMFCSVDILFEMEFYFGCLYHSLSKEKGMNMQLPKISDKFIPLSEEARKNRSVKLIGRKLSPEHRAKMTGKKASPETLIKLRNSHLGHKPKPESIMKTANALRGVKRPAGMMEKLAQFNRGKPMHPNSFRATEANRQRLRKKVIDTKTGQIFNSIAEASAHIGKVQPYVSNMLLGKQNNNTNLVFLSTFLSQQKRSCSGNLLFRIPVLAGRPFGPLRLDLTA